MPRNNRIFSGQFSNTDDQTLGLGSLQIGSPNYYTQVSHTSIEPLALQPSSKAKGKGKKGKKQKSSHTKVFEEWKAYFGAESNLANWQRLCGDLGLDDNLPSITKCKQALSPIWVNIHDFLQERRTANTANPYIAPRFKSEHALAAYTMKHELYFPKRKAKEGGALRSLLARIF